MGFYERVILPQLVERLLRTRPISAERKLALAGVAGRVLEIGFGTGLNLPHYGPEVSELLAIDPSGSSAKMAASRMALAPFPVRFSPLSGESLPFASGEFDAVVSTFTLCTIPDVATALREARRVLKPDGRLYFLEHGLDPDPGVARWQARLNPLQSFFGGGCQLNRDIPALIEAAGFTGLVVERYDSGGLRIASGRFRGWAEP